MKNSLPFLLALIIRAISKTLRLTTINIEALKAAQEQKKPIVYAFWHGRQFILFRFNQDQQLVVMTSLSKDGQLQAKVLKQLGFYPVSGSSSRGAVRGLISMVRGMRDGRNACITVDGPRGPIAKVKPGVIYLASKTDSLIIPITSKAKHSHIFQKAWCKYELPYPFSKAVVILGEPIAIPKNLDDTLIEEKRQELESSLHRITEKADAFFTAQ